jgi:hypothetical protein
MKMGNSLDKIPVRIATEREITKTTVRVYLDSRNKSLNLGIRISFLFGASFRILCIIELPNSNGKRQNARRKTNSDFEMIETAMIVSHRPMNPEWEV